MLVTIGPGGLNWTLLCLVADWAGQGFLTMRASSRRSAPLALQEEAFVFRAGRDGGTGMLTLSGCPNCVLFPGVLK